MYTVAYKLILLPYKLKLKSLDNHPDVQSSKEDKSLPFSFEAIGRQASKLLYVWSYKSTLMYSTDFI